MSREQTDADEGGEAENAHTPIDATPGEEGQCWRSGRSRRPGRRKTSSPGPRKTAPRHSTGCAGSRSRARSPLPRCARRTAPSCRPAPSISLTGTRRPGAWRPPLRSTPARGTRRPPSAPRPAPPCCCRNSPWARRSPRIRSCTGSAGAARTPGMRGGNVPPWGSSIRPRTIPTSASWKQASISSAHPGDTTQSPSVNRRTSPRLDAKARSSAVCFPVSSRGSCRVVDHARARPVRRAELVEDPPRGVGRPVIHEEKKGVRPASGPAGTPSRAGSVFSSLRRATTISGAERLRSDGAFPPRSVAQEVPAPARPRARRGKRGSGRSGRRSRRGRSPWRRTA